MAGSISIGGLVSGMKTEEILAKILEVERRPVQQYQTRQETLRTRLKAYQEANTRLAALKEAAGQLASASFFASRTAVSSKPESIGVSADVGATPGDFVMSVETLARAHQVLSQSYSDLDTTTLGMGTLTITAGGETTTIEVDDSNNTLVGLRDAINNAGGNVRASIVQDSDSSYRLMISSKETGTANSLTLGSTLAGGTAPSFSDLQTAEDAKLQLGVGDDAITVTRSTNLIADLIPGVTLNLLEASPGTPRTLTVTQDTTRIRDAIQKFVDQYNNAVTAFNEQFRYDPDTDRGGTLAGDFALRQIQSDVLQVMTGSVPGVAQGALADIGITTGSGGQLTIDLAALEQKLGEDPEAVTNVFALTAKSTHTGVQLLSVGSATKVDGTAYEVEISQAARQARVTSGIEQTGALATGETLTLNGVELSLTAGMTQAQVIQTINARAGETGIRASATDFDGTGTGSYLTFRSVAYGSAASVSIVSSRSSAGGDSSGVGNVTATMTSPGGQAGSGTGETGLDVVGTINGENATGSGQILTGSSGNTATDGLKLRVTAASTGVLGTLQLFDGIAHAAQRTLDRITDPVDGRLMSEEDSIQHRIDDLQSLIDAREESIVQREAQVRRQFNSMEEALARFQQQSAFFASQVSAK